MSDSWAALEGTPVMVADGFRKDLCKLVLEPLFATDGWTHEGDEEANVTGHAPRTPDFRCYWLAVLAAGGVAS